MTPLLIDIYTLKKTSLIDGNVDEKLISSTIRMVQDIWLQKLLGTDLYNELCSQKDDDNISAANQYLLDNYIDKFLQCATIAEGLENMSFRLSNKGVVSQNSENQFPVSDGQMKMASNKWRGNAEFYAQGLTKYLCENSTTYPLYNANQESYKINPAQQKYSSEIFLGNVRRRNSYWPTYCRCGNRYCTCNE